MCRNIKPLFNFDPPATDDEIRAAAVQFARKLSGMSTISAGNQAAIDAAAEEFSITARRLLASLQTTAHTKSREAEAIKAAERSKKRFGSSAEVK